jgi:SAM-dependent methyltransferase
MGREAVEVLRQTGRSQFSFVEKNLSEPDPLPEGPFDVAFARLLLVHLPDRLDVLRRMYEATRPGGVVLVQDAYSAAFSILPPPRTWGVIERIYPGIVDATGKDRRFGFTLPIHFVNAGLGPPDGTAVHGGVGWLEDWGDVCLSTLNGLVPAAVRLGLVTEDEAQACVAEVADLARTKHQVVFAPGLMVSAWRRKPT